MILVDSIKVRHLMLDLGLKNLTELSQVAHVHKNTVYDFVSGGQFEINTLEHIARALGVPALSLLKEVPDEENAVAPAAKAAT